jgi:hypothetical protein
MGQEIIYQWVSDGVNVEISSTTIPDTNSETNGTADLVAGKIVINSIHAGKAVILSRNQDNTTGFGHLYVYTPNTIDKVSFEIRSSNTADSGTVFWQIVE